MFYFHKLHRGLLLGIESGTFWLPVSSFNNYVTCPIGWKFDFEIVDCSSMIAFFDLQDIIGKLVEQSETFQTKTEFSQEKYLKKKKKKLVRL